MYGSLFYVLPILAVIAKTVFRAVLPLLIGCMSPMYDTLLPFACACDPDLMVDDRPSAVILHPDHRNRFPPGFRITV